MKDVKLYYVSEIARVLPRVNKNGVAYFLSTKGIEPTTIYTGLKRTTRLYSQEAFDAAVEIGKQMDKETEALREQKVAKLLAKPAKEPNPDITVVLEAVAALDRRVEFLQTCLMAIIVELNIKIPE